jgi:hypothetical protein
VGRWADTVEPSTQHYIFHSAPPQVRRRLKMFLIGLERRQSLPQKICVALQTVIARQLALYLRVLVLVQCS